VCRLIKNMSETNETIFCVDCRNFRMWNDERTIILSTSGSPTSNVCGRTSGRAGRKVTRSLAPPRGRLPANTMILGTRLGDKHSGHNMGVKSTDQPVGPSQDDANDNKAQMQPAAAWRLLHDLSGGDDANTVVSAAEASVLLLKHAADELDRSSSYPQYTK